MPPDLIHAIPGCPFYPRCAYREARNELEMPPLKEVAPGHKAACWIDVRVTKPHEIADETEEKVGVS
jgi:ABC-type dipeptide/oligopeptide/nickel transport system ATPase component